MPVRPTLPPGGHDGDEDDDVEDDVDVVEGVAGVDDEPEPLPDDDDESLVDDEPADSPLDDEPPSLDGVVAAVRDDEPRLSVL